MNDQGNGVWWALGVAAGLAAVSQVKRGSRASGYRPARRDEEQELPYSIRVDGHFECPDVPFADERDDWTYYYDPNREDLPDEDTIEEHIKDSYESGEWVDIYREALEGNCTLKITDVHAEPEYEMARTISGHQYPVGRVWRNE